jgi:hypothetical protein
MNKTKISLIVMLALTILLLFGNVNMAQAQTGTPTPDAEGFVRVAVQQGDSLWSIAAKAGLTLDELLTLNNLANNATISPGQTLIVGFFAPTPTPVPPPTATPLVPPTATANPQGELCVSAFADFNQNSLQEDGEILLADVRIDVQQNGTIVQSHLTDTSQVPRCFLLPPGTYGVERLVEGTETLTTAPRAEVVVENAGKTQVAFGNVPPFDLVAEATPTNPEVEPIPPMFAGNSWVGSLLLLFVGITTLIGIALLLIPTAITIPKRY